MDDLLKPYAGLVVSHATLLSVLSAYQAPNFKIHRWLDEGALISLKRGIYAVPDPSSQSSLFLPLLANHLYGPSYVSIEFRIMGVRVKLNFSGYQVELRNLTGLINTTNSQRFQVQLGTRVMKFFTVNIGLDPIIFKSVPLLYKILAFSGITRGCVVIR